MGFREYGLINCLHLFSGEYRNKYFSDKHTVSKSLLLRPAFLIRPLSMSLLEETSDRGSFLDMTIPSSWKREPTNELCPSSSNDDEAGDRWTKSDRTDLSRAARAAKKTKIISRILPKTLTRGTVEQER